jgi:site-specific recombinase XerD
MGAATVRKSLNVVSREAAQKIVDRWEKQGFIDTDLSFLSSSEQDPEQSSLRNPSRVTSVDEAIQEFLLKLFCRRTGLQYLCQIDLDETRKFRGSWSTSANTSAKRLERLRAFFRFCQDSQWIDENPAAKLKSPKTDTHPTFPFTQDEMARILAGCDAFWGSNKKPGGQNAKRLKAFVLLMGYFGPAYQ